MITAREYITDVKITARDTAINRIVKGVIMGRGSKKLFASEEYVSSEIEKLRDNQPDDIQPTAKIKSVMSKSFYGRMPVYSLRKDAEIPRKQLIYLHGGAFFRQPNKAHWVLADKLSQLSGAQINVALYPKTPTSDYRPAYECITGMYKDLVAKYGAENVFFAGDSCGTTIALCLSKMFADERLPLPAHLIMYSPLCDMVCNNPEMDTIETNDPMLAVGGLGLFLKAWAGAEDIYSTKINPCRMTFENGFPPVTVFTGTNEILLPDTLEFAERLNRAGGRVRVYRCENMYHAFVLFPLSAAEFAIEKTVGIING